jgi:trk system potassium uptake protein TrkH
MKLLNRSLILLVGILLMLCTLFQINSLNFIERFFIYFSFITSTGMLPNNTSDILVLQQILPLFFIFLILITIGSLSGSSGGGLKLDKVSIIFIKIKTELKKLTLSHKLYGADLIKKGFNQKELNSLFALLALGGIFVLGSVLILTSIGNSVFNSFVLAMASLTNTGEGFIYINDISLNKNAFSYLVLNFLMIFGRFEVIGYLLIFQKFTIRN